MTDLVRLDEFRKAIAATKDIRKLKDMDRQLDGLKKMFVVTREKQAELIELRVDLGIKIGTLLGPPMTHKARATKAGKAGGRGRKKATDTESVAKDAEWQADRRYRAMEKVPKEDPEWNKRFRAELKDKDSKHTPTEYSGKGLQLGRRKREDNDSDDGAETQSTYYLTGSQKVLACDALITDPPYGILEEEWEPDQLQEFTMDWATRWNECEAPVIAVFFSQRWMWEARKWFDKAFANYHFQQLLVWVYQNNKSPQSRRGFKQTWEPIFFYRNKDTDREIDVGKGEWGEGLNDFDTHVAGVPQSNWPAANEKRHPAQKPVSAMRWLINAMTEPDELIVDPFCGSGTTGVAALQLGRNFHGIEISKEYRGLAEERIEAYG